MKTIKLFASCLLLAAFFAIPFKGKAVNNSSTNSIIKIEEKDKRASFPGGKEELKKWLKDNMDYPEDIRRYGTVVIDFMVKKNGKLSDFKIHKGVNKDLDIVAIEILRGMPKWEPAIKDGKAVDSNVQLPVKFVPKEEKGGLSDPEESDETKE